MALLAPNVHHGPPATRPVGPAAAPGVPLVARLGGHGDRVAVRTADGTVVSYRELAARVDGVARHLGPGRRLVLLTGANDLDTLVAYLGALRGGHPVLVVPRTDDHHLAGLVEAYDPDVLVRASADGDPFHERRAGTVHDLHPDLALVLSTSGSTGSSKLVRLSRANVQSNAEAIAEVLEVRATDLAATTLPMSYCYGLSVIHSNLARGAGLLLGEGSVVDPCFWERFRAEGATTFAGVPHTFALLDRVGFDGMELPSLRYVTQAGGRLAPDRVRHYAGLARRGGWRFHVMYGQTEATARMAVLPAQLAEEHPSSIGRPVPGGSFELEPLGDGTIDVTDGGADEGELVYRGPNVMMGYAHTPADLALGPGPETLRTGDVARRLDDGLYEIVGRRSRFVKIVGLRIDLDRVEQVLAAEGYEAICTGDDDRLAVGVRSDDDVTAEVAGLVARRFSLPAGAVGVAAFHELPLLPNAKPDRLAVARRVGRAADAAATGGAPGAAGLTQRVAALLGRDDVGPGDSFASLGGDSLSYVEVSLAVEAELGHLPEGWHVTPLGRLAALERRPRRFLRPMETGVVLRAVAIVAVVATHLHLVGWQGGAHVLLAVAGFNLARFQLGGDGDDRAGPGRALRTSCLRVAVPAVAWIAFQLAVDDRHTLANLALVNNYLADGTWRYWYWFVEVLVHVLVLVGAVLSIPAVRRLERRAPFGFALGFLVAALVARTVPFGDPVNDVFRTHAVLWLFALGWLAQRATDVPRRLVVTAAVVLAVPGFFASGSQALVVALGLALVLWVPHLPVPAPLHRVVGSLAGASLYIYLTHWMVLDRLWGHASAEVTAVVALVVGVATWSGVQWGTARLRDLRRRGRVTHRTVGGGSTTDTVGASRLEPSGGWPAT